MADRREFLETVRRAIRAGTPHEGEPAPPVPLLPPEEKARRARETLEALARRRPAVLDRLRDIAPKQAWDLREAHSAEEAVSLVADILRDLGARRVVRTAHPLLKDGALDGALQALGIQVTPLVHDPHDPEGSRRRLREEAERADAGITGVDFVVAETGSVVLRHPQGVSRLASLLPPVHIALARADQVVETLDEVMVLLQGDPGSYLTLISGPSRTGDIEQTIIVGVHGPKRVYLVLVRE